MFLTEAILKFERRCNQEVNMDLLTVVAGR